MKHACAFALLVLFALPLTAVVYLHASPTQMGLLGAAALLPHLVLGLPNPYPVGVAQWAVDELITPTYRY